MDHESGTLSKDWAPPRRTLMGPGPSDVSPAVRAALAAPLVGHLDPAFLELMDRVQAMLRTLFRTDNRMTLPISGTGSAGMEACLTNLVEPGDAVVVGQCGAFGGRLAEVARRAGGRVEVVEAPWGEIVPEDAMERAIDEHRPKVVAWVHAETSTGVWQPVERIARAARQAGALTVLDCVTSLGGCPVEIDAWGIDAAYSGTQKCLSCPPGLAPVTFGDRAIAAIERRSDSPRSWYLDVSLLGGYWGGDRAYHHTAPISMNYALHAALGEALAEGLEARHARHRACHEALVSGLADLGLSLLPREGERLWMLNAVRVPDGVDETAVRMRLLEDHGIEIGAGLGPLRGRVWRIGIMGASCTPGHVSRVLEALRDALRT